MSRRTNSAINTASAKNAAMPTDAATADRDNSVTTDTPDSAVNNPDTQTASPVAPKYAYDPATVVRAYQTGAIRLDNAKSAANAAMAATVKIAGDAMASGNTDSALAAMAESRVHALAIDALVAAAKTATTSARVITVADYVAATLSRVIAMRNASHALRNGDIIPNDVPAKMHSDYVTAIRAFDTRTATATDSETKRYRDAAMGRVIGNASVIGHYAEIANGRATDKNGGEFTPEIGHVYPFAVISKLRTSEYPAGNLSHGAASAPFVPSGDASREIPSGWAYATMPAGSRATHGAKFVGVKTSTDTATDSDESADTDTPSA